MHHLLGVLLPRFNLVKQRVEKGALEEVSVPHRSELRSLLQILGQPQRFEALAKDL